MRHFCLLDHSARFIYISQTIEGTTPEQFIGGRPWDFVVDEDVEYHKEQILSIYEEGVDKWHFGSLWSNPSPPHQQVCYFVELQWLGLQEVAALMHVWEFPPELSRLSKRQRETLELIGAGCGVKAVAAELNLTVSTVRTHIQSIREKLGLDSQEHVVAFASRFRDVCGKRTLDARGRRH